MCPALTRGSWRCLVWALRSGTSCARSHFRTMEAASSWIPTCALAAPHRSPFFSVTVAPCLFYLPRPFAGASCRCEAGLGRRCRRSRGARGGQATARSVGPSGHVDGVQPSGCWLRAAVAGRILMISARHLLMIPDGVCGAAQARGRWWIRTCLGGGSEVGSRRGGWCVCRANPRRLPLGR